MSDVEHEYVLENRTLRDELARVQAIAIRALRGLIEAQDAATERHEAWLDEALVVVVAEKVEHRG